MVFAAEKPIRIFGEGTGTVEISFAGSVAQTVGTENGWTVEFPPMDFGGPYTLSARFDDTSLLLEDIYVGRVFLISGQSNMQFELRDTSFPKTEYRADSMVRFFLAPRVEEEKPYSSSAGWMPATLDNIPNWSAIAYHVGHLAARDGVAVGVVGCYKGASIIESWLPEGTLDRLDIHVPLELRNRDHVSPNYKAWNSEGILYKKSLSPLFPFSFSGVVWYQGESNYYPAEALVYKQELAELIRIWRESFQDDLLPFVVVQIADYIPRLGEGWSNIQKAQYEIQFETEAVRTVISADVSEADDIHPPTKIHLSERIVDALKSLL